MSEDIIRIDGVEYERYYGPGDCGGTTITVRLRPKRRNCENCGKGCQALLWVLSQAVPEEKLKDILRYSEQCQGWIPR